MQRKSWVIFHSTRELFLLWHKTRVTCHLKIIGDINVPLVCLHLPIFLLDILTPSSTSFIPVVFDTATRHRFRKILISEVKRAAVLEFFSRSSVIPFRAEESGGIFLRGNSFILWYFYRLLGSFWLIFTFYEGLFASPISSCAFLVPHTLPKAGLRLPACNPIVEHALERFRDH